MMMVAGLQKAQTLAKLVLVLELVKLLNLLMKQTPAVASRGKFLRFSKQRAFQVGLVCSLSIG